MEELHNLLGIQHPPESTPSAVHDPGVMESGEAKLTSDQGKNDGAGVVAESSSGARASNKDESVSDAQVSANFVGKLRFGGMN